MDWKAIFSVGQCALKLWVARIYTQAARVLLDKGSEICSIVSVLFDVYSLLDKNDI